MPAPKAGQATVAGAQTQLDSGNTAINCAAFTIKAPAANTASVYIGPSGVTSATGHCLDPGDELTYERLAQNGSPRYECNLSDFYLASGSNTSDKVTWLASP